ncbi:MAG TPA: FprA family A-type flavoprotein [Bacteroidetes bacterium]|nr:FprA family A-type flavoprotein [Bacteroidota bacterium]
MITKEITKDVFFLGGIDWNRRLFDSLIPLPDGTSYNAYLIRGSEKTVLLDAVDPSMAHQLLDQLKEVEKIDFIISHHAEQDHSGAIPHVLEKYPDAKVIATPKGKDLLIDHLPIPADKIQTVADGEELSLGNKSLKFIHYPWVHWPETMLTYLKEEHILFTCDFFGSHLATSETYVSDECRVYEAAKRYYAEIMMPFRKIIKKNFGKLNDYHIRIIAPSHGPLYHKPEFIIEAYKEWISDEPGNLVVLPYISMHGSVEKMVETLVDALGKKGVVVQPFDLTVTDIGKLAISLVDAATIVIGTPTVLGEPHPMVAYAARLADLLKPKVKFASVIATYGWGTSVVEKIAEMIPHLKVELIDPVVVKGHPKESDFRALDELAEKIAAKHRDHQFKS